MQKTFKTLNKHVTISRDRSTLRRGAEHTMQ